MVKESELKPIYVFAENRGAGYLYNGNFVPKHDGVLCDSLLNKEFSWDVKKELKSLHPLVVNRDNVKVTIEFVEQDHICGDWFRIREELN